MAWTRRRWLGAWTCGLLAGSGRTGGRAECIAGGVRAPWPVSGTVFAFTAGLSQTSRFAILGCDVATNTWALAGDATYAFGRVSPGGRLWASERFDASGGSLGTWLHDLSGRTDSRCLREEGGQPRCWWPDGRSLVVSAPEGNLVVPLDGSPERRLPLPESDTVVDISADGRWLLTQSDRRPDGDPASAAESGPALYAIRSDGRDEQLLFDGRGPLIFPRISPCGRLVSYATYWDTTASYGLVIVDRSSGSARRLLASQPDAEPFQAAWSPDGTRLAVLMLEFARDEDSGAKSHRGCHLAVTDTFGRSPKRLAVPTLDVIRLIDWR
jgi:dipeptidyl aminopeptidase/acylaminoacyl peptidase